MKVIVDRRTDMIVLCVSGRRSYALAWQNGSLEVGKDKRRRSTERRRTGRGGGGGIKKTES
jgi:hypothetical protein